MVPITPSLYYWSSIELTEHTKSIETLHRSFRLPDDRTLGRGFSWSLWADRKWCPKDPFAGHHTAYERTFLTAGEVGATGVSICIYKPYG